MLQASHALVSALLAAGLILVGLAAVPTRAEGEPPQTHERIHDGKPVLDDALSSRWGPDYFAQGGVVTNGVAYFTADQSYSKHWKGPEFPFVVAFDMANFRRLRTYPFQDTYDSCPLVIRRRDGVWLVIAHEYKNARTVAMDRDSGEVLWASDNNQPGAYFFGYSYYTKQDGTKLILAASQNGLHAMSGETGADVWWLASSSTGGVTPCVDQATGWVFYQSDGRVVKVRAADGSMLASTSVGWPDKCVSWNTVLVKDEHGYYVATYWFSFRSRDGTGKQMGWTSAIRVFDSELNLVWERTGLPGAKKSTLTYADGKLVIGTGGHWGARYVGTHWKYIAAYAVDTGKPVWRCDLSGIEYDGIINVPYAYGRFFAESWGKTGKLLRINGKTGKLEQVLDYGVGIGSCAPCLIARGMMLSGDLPRDGVLITRLAEGSTAEWPGPFGDPQTNTYALPDEPEATLVPMCEIATPGPDSVPYQPSAGP